MNYTGPQLRKAMLAAALAEHDRPVRSIGDEDRISRYFAGCGWQWHLDEHCDGVYDDSRRRGAILQWCGIFPAWCALRVGEHLEAGQCVPVRVRPGIANYVLPSTWRSQSVDQWAAAGIAPPRQIPHTDLEPGDIVTVVTSRNLTYGDHFAIVVDCSGDGSWIDTVEGNAVGELGDGSRGRGVIRRSRPVADVRRVYRLEPGHFEEAG